VVAVWRAGTGKRGGGSGQRATAAAGRQRPGHASHGRAGVATQNRGGGALLCGAHDTVSVGNDSGTPATGGRAWPLKTEEVGRYRVGPMTQCRSTWHTYERGSRAAAARMRRRRATVGAARSWGSRGGGGADKWASPEGGSQRQRERRKRGTVTGGTAGFK
jgi:hypothetical protein